MQIRRAVAGLSVALTLFGGAASLAGCSATGNSRTGTPADSSTSSKPSSPPSNDNLPNDSNQKPGAHTSQGPGGSG